MKQVQLDILGKENPFELIGQQWMLITDGDKESFNTMTASSGHEPRISQAKEL